MADGALSPLADDEPLVFGIQCPYCTRAHLLSALGVSPGQEGIQDPTITLVQMDEEGVAHVRCLTCWETFGLIAVVRVFKDPNTISRH
jgi:DNA-directed RNA polymerase subunit RPC12/RpoP